LLKSNRRRIVQAEFWLVEVWGQNTASSRVDVYRSLQEALAQQQLIMSTRGAIANIVPLDRKREYVGHNNPDWTEP
jgi:hypothetical protein